MPTRVQERSRTDRRSDVQDGRFTSRLSPRARQGAGLPGHLPARRRRLHRMSRAEHLRGQPVPTTIRFANASGDPNVHDGQPNVRSMAVKLPVAGAKTRRHLGQFDRGLRRPDTGGAPGVSRGATAGPGHGQADPGCRPPVPGKPSGREGLHRTIDGQADSRQLRPGDVPLGAMPFASRPPTGRADSAAITGCRRPARRFCRPSVGAQRGANFLHDELAERLASGPAVFRLTLQVAAGGDPTDDPTALWPADRRRRPSWGDWRSAASRRPAARTSNA